MGDHEQSAVVFRGDVAKQGKNFPSGFRIQRSRRLVGEQDGGFSRNSAGDGHALPLSHGKLVWSRMETVTQPHATKDFGSSLPGASVLSSTKTQADNDVLYRGEWSKEMKGLEDHPAVGAAVPVELCGAQAGEFRPGHVHFTFVGATQAGDKV